MHARTHARTPARTHARARAAADYLQTHRRTDMDIDTDTDTDTDTDSNTGTGQKQSQTLTQTQSDTHIHRQSDTHKQYTHTTRTQHAHNTRTTRTHAQTSHTLTQTYDRSCTFDFFESAAVESAALVHFLKVQLLSLCNLPTHNKLIPEMDQHSGRRRDYLLFIAPTSRQLP